MSIIAVLLPLSASASNAYLSSSTFVLSAWRACTPLARQVLCKSTRVVVQKAIDLPVCSSKAPGSEKYIGAAIS